MYRYVLYLRAELIGHFVRTEELYRPLFGNGGGVSIEVYVMRFCTPSPMRSLVHIPIRGREHNTPGNW